MAQIRLKHYTTEHKEIYIKDGILYKPFGVQYIYTHPDYGSIDFNVILTQEDGYVKLSAPSITNYINIEKGYILGAVLKIPVKDKFKITTTNLTCGFITMDRLNIQTLPCWTDIKGALPFNDTIYDYNSGKTSLMAGHQFSLERTTTIENTSIASINNQIALFSAEALADFIDAKTIMNIQNVRFIDLIV